MPQVQQTPTIQTGQPQQRQNKSGLLGFVTNAIAQNWPGAAAALLGVPALEGLASGVLGGGETPKNGPTPPAEAPKSDTANTASHEVLGGGGKTMVDEPMPNFDQIPLQSHILASSQMQPQLMGSSPGVPQAPPPVNPNPLPGVPSFQMLGMQSPQQPTGFYTPPPYHLMQKYGNWWGGSPT